MSSSVSKLLAEETKQPVNIAVFGRCGVGKSTIGNFILNNDFEGPFKVSNGADACTTASETKTRDNVSFTDFPGLPDTNAKLTKSCYNMCIDELKCRKYSVLLFVFPKGQKELDVYEQAGILFEEINKVECEKILIINDKNSYGFGGPGRNYDNDISDLAGAISACTNIRFYKTISVTVDTMQERIRCLVETIKFLNLMPVMSPKLRNFDEMELWIDELSKNKDFLKAVREKKTEEKEQLERELKRTKAIETGILIAGAVAVAGAAVTGGAAVVAGDLLAAAAVPALASSVVGAIFGGLKFRSASLEDDIKKIQKELDEGDFDAAVEELKKKMSNFVKLRDALKQEEKKK